MRPRCFHRPCLPASPRGFTLVEVLVSLVLIEIGLLALAASSAVVIRETVFVRARVSAIEAARNRVESIAATSCAATSGSVSAANGLREEWLTRVGPPSAREIRDSVTITTQRLTRAVVFQTRTACTP